MEQSLVFQVEGEELVFDCRRAIYWPRQRALLTADLHWGKTQYLRNHGIGISDRVLEADLKRLGDLINDYQAERVIVLGDLIHHEDALTHGIITRIADFRNAYPVEFILIKGNHDRLTRFPPSWGIVEEEDLLVKPFLLSHQPVKNFDGFQMTGHLHPMLRLKFGPDNLRLPCYVLDEKYCLLPAFSEFTGGQDIKLQNNQEALVLTGDGIELFSKTR